MDLYTENREFHIFVNESFNRYIKCDWGDVCQEDWKNNNRSVIYGDRILAVYEFPNNPDWKIWIITEWDRSVTTILFPDEY